MTLPFSSLSQTHTHRHRHTQTHTDTHTHARTEVPPCVVAADGREVTCSRLGQRGSRVGRDQHGLLGVGSPCFTVCACACACICASRMRIMWVCVRMCIYICSCMFMCTSSSICNRSQCCGTCPSHNFAKAVFVQRRCIICVTAGTLASCKAGKLGKSDALLPHDLQVFTAVQHALVEPPPHALPDALRVEQQRVEAHGQRAEAAESRRTLGLVHFCEVEIAAPWGDRWEINARVR